MQKFKKLLIRNYQKLSVFFGLGAIILALILSPNLVAAYISSDHQLDESTLRLITDLRIFLAILGIIFILHKKIFSVLKSLIKSIQKNDPILNGFVSRINIFKTLFFVLLAIVLCFLSLRFFSINADFPSGITTSSEIYTDEGWYTTAAVRHYLTGQWYQEGEVNTAIAAPIGHIIHRLGYSIFGLSSSTARITISICFVFVTIFSSLLVRRDWGNFAGLLTGAILALNFLAFAYSRLGTPYLIATCFVVAGLFVVGKKSDRFFLFRIIVASLLVSLGILTHGTAMVAIPLVAFLIITNRPDAKKSLFYLAISGIIILLIVGGHRYLSNLRYPDDYILYNASTVDHMFTSVHDWAWNFEYKLLRRLFNLGSGLFLVTLIFTVIAFFTSERFRKDNLFQLFSAYIIIYIGMLSLNSYGPMRYYLPLLVPLSGLTCIACFALIEKLREAKLTILAIIPIVIVLSTLWLESSKVVTYLSNPQYSFYQMNHDIEKIIMHKEGSVQGIVLFGDIADSVSLEIGTDARNSLLINEDLKAKVNEIRPKYMIVHISNIDMLATELGGTVIELGAWDVFGNYYANGEQVRLYEVTWPHSGSN